MTVIRTIRPNKGDLVVGHQVYAFFPGDLPAVGGRIAEVSSSGASVVFEVTPALGILGLPRRTRWTWRKSVGAYQQAGTRTVEGSGLAIVRN